MILDTLTQLYNGQRDAVEDWLAARRVEAPPLMTTSVDMRHSGMRLVPVDVNLFPAGFQNLSANARTRAAGHFREALTGQSDRVRRVLIVPESHTRNLPYLDNLRVLSDIMAQAGFEVVIGSLAMPAGKPLALTTASGAEIVQHPLVQQGGRLMTEAGFDPDVILLNNDCTSGWPPLLQSIAQPIVPSPALGWHNRKKETHFLQYDRLAREFADHFAFDPWLISSYFDAVQGLNFKARSGVDELARKIDALIERIRIKHREYGILYDPHVFVKANRGTYGMGIMVIHSGSEIIEMNKKERNKMHVIKEGAEVHDVILQEGVPTEDMVDGKPAEPMVYMVDGVPIGGMFRINGQRDRFGNLNATGMEYAGMCDEKETVKGSRHPVKSCDFCAYGLVAGLSALAAGREAEQVGQNGVAVVMAQG